jgi:threonine/homoserine/homoserine lactone efflux protein
MLLLPLLKGVVIGIIIALPVGPVGVLCVRRTLFEGAAFGLVSGLGAASADTLYAVVAGFGLTAVSASLLAYETPLGAAGGVFLIFLGLRALATPEPAPEPLRGEALLGAFASTFALTITNPLTILAFAGIFAALGIGAGATYPAIAALIIGVFVGSLLWWLAIAVATVVLRQSLGRGAALVGLSRVTGAILTLSGAALVIAAALRAAGMIG